jgi:hypothetical protein
MATATALRIADFRLNCLLFGVTAKLAHVGGKKIVAHRIQQIPLLKQVGPIQLHYELAFVNQVGY